MEQLVARPNRRALRAVLVAVLLAMGLLPLTPPSASAQTVQVLGAGSTWSAIAVDQWRADVRRQGISINYNPVGSTSGRKFYYAGTVDFAVSEIPFQGPTINREGQPEGDELEPASRRPYAYMPIVAGGTSFMYHLDVNGERVTNLRLSGETIAKIFTGAIKNWNDPAITRDDGRTFPDQPMKPVVRSDGSGTSAQFTAYMADQFPSIWKAGQTSLFPYSTGSTSAQGSDGVANAVSASYNNGSITYVEYGYAKERRYPVVSVKNEAGYFVQPTAGNVAVALSAARINPDRTQVLNDVYRNPDRRAYPVSSYSYMIVPTTTAAPFTEAKGKVLGDFINYFLCTGQQKAEQLGYSPLPENLVGYAQDALGLIPGAPAPTPLSQCENPAIGVNLERTAPPPPPDAAPTAAPPALPGGGTGSANRTGGSDAVSAADLARGTNNGPTPNGVTPAGDPSTPAEAGGGDTTAEAIGGDAASLDADGDGTIGAAEAGDVNGDGVVDDADLAALDADGDGVLETEEVSGLSIGSSDGEETLEADLAATTSVDGDAPVPVIVYFLVALMLIGVVFGPPALSTALRARRASSSS